METHLEPARSTQAVAASGLRLALLGPPGLLRNAAPVRMPASRKVRALLVYLALAERPVGRSSLCELLWDVPNDPRGELRWCLSKLRALLDDAARRRVVTGDDAVCLDLTDCAVDAVEVERAMQEGPAALGTERLARLAALFDGEFAEGFEVARSAEFDRWLVARRSRYRSHRAALLEHLLGRLPPGTPDGLRHAENWVNVAPFDVAAHARFLAELRSRGDVGACEAHVAAARRAFEAEGVDVAPVVEAWGRLRRSRAETAMPNAPGPAAAPASAIPVSAMALEPAAGPRRASIAVMPFAAEGARRGGGPAHGLTHDIITRLAKLRSLFVIARGSVFALADRNVGPDEAGRRLGVDYVVSGSLHRGPEAVVVSVELVETRTARIVWADSFEERPDDTFGVLDRIGDSIVSSVSSEIETAERNRALLKPPNSLDAWEAYHRGLWHMYRFTRDENESARRFFRRSLELDPTFARAHAGLSFTHWQSAFQRWDDRATETRLAYDAAAQSLMLDDHNPAAHWAMGRAMWLGGRHDEAVRELERTVDLSPNFALGHYALAFVHAQSGDPRAAIGSADHSRQLSPFDPLLFAMLAARALAHVRLGEYEEAAEWAVEAAARPNAHVVIVAVAAFCLGAAGRLEEARRFAARLRATWPRYRIDDFLTTFRFPPDTAALFRGVAARIGLD